MRVERARASLSAKGFAKRSKRNHYCFFFYRDGLKTAVHTKFSHGRQISAYQFRQMRRQLRLSDDQQLDRLLSCDMGGDEYLAHLVAAGVFPGA